MPLSKLLNMNFKYMRPFMPEPDMAQVDLVGQFNSAAIAGDLELSLVLLRKISPNCQCEEGRTPLISAIMGGNCEIVRLLIEVGADLDYSDYSKRTPLMYAVEFRNYEIIKLLIAFMLDGVDMNYKSILLERFFMLAVKLGDLGILELMLEGGADVNRLDRNGETPLMLAVISMRFDNVKFLIERGANADYSGVFIYAMFNIHHIDLDHSEESANAAKILELILKQSVSVDYKEIFEDKFLKHKDVIWKVFLLAKKHGFYNILELLLEKGNNIDYQDILVYSAICGFIDITKLSLEKGANIDHRSNGGTPIVRAVEKRRVEIVEFLIEKGADVSYLLYTGQTPLTFAIDRGFFDIVELLLKKRAKGLDVNCQDSNGKTPLIVAIERSYFDIVKLLLDAGADIDIEDAYGNTALAIAVLRGSVRILKLLLKVKRLKVKRDMDCQDNLLDKLFIRAVSHMNMESIKFLLDEGVNVNYKDDLGRISLIVAVEIRYLPTTTVLQVVKLLLERKADINCRDNDGETPLIVAARNGFIEFVELLLDNGAGIDHQDNYGKTPLIFAVESLDVKMVKFLLERGANVDHQDNDGATPLNFAVRDSHLTIIGLLLGRGASVDCQDRDGRTPLMLVAMQDEDVESAKLLLESGASLDCQDKDGKTPLMFALQYENVKIVELLLATVASVHSQDKDGETILNGAPELENMEILQVDAPVGYVNYFC